MATFNWEVYANTPGWFDVSTNTIVFSGSLSDLSTPITVGTWNSGTHLGNDDPGTDQCGTNHVPNCEYVSGTQFKTNGGSTETLNNTNLAATECTMRVKFTDASSVAISNARFYAYDGSTETNPAVGVETYAVEGQVAASSWSMLNDYSASTGGDNTGQRLTLTDQTASTIHYFYVGVSARPESVGAKTQFDFGIALTYS